MGKQHRAITKALVIFGLSYYHHYPTIMYLQDQMDKIIKKPEFPPEFTLSVMGSILAFLIAVLMCVASWMCIKSIIGIYQECCQLQTSEENHGKEFYSESTEDDIKSGNPMTYHPYFTTVRHSILGLH